jgi:hypothetical protein
MVDAGYVSDVTEAFDRFLADDAPAFVPVGALTPAQAVELIVQSGGAAVIAHPAQLKLPPAALADVVDALADAGMSGIEAYRPEHDDATRAQLAGLAESRGLVATAGSDFHRPPVDGGPELGDVGPVPDGFDPLPALGISR